MTSDGFHLAQFNVARLLAPLDDPRLAGFVTALEGINAIADGSPGFVWRLQDDGGDATGFRPFGPEVIVNLSVWRGIEELFDYAYRSPHAAVLARRQGWFVPPTSPHLVLWWVPAGHRPNLAEASERLAKLARDGPTVDAFTFKTRFAAPGESSAASPA